MIKNSDELPQDAAARIWEETGRDPIETLRRFDEWAQQTPERMMAVLGRYWTNCVRGFLERGQHVNGAWRYSDSFRRTMNELERTPEREAAKARSKRRRERMDSDQALQSKKLHSARSADLTRRARSGIKRVFADVDIKTGEILTVIDREYGPFAHIRINGCCLQEVTPAQALRYCDEKTADVRFIHALCRMLPNPTKPIGEQWTADMIRKAKAEAEREGREVEAA